MSSSVIKTSGEIEGNMAASSAHNHCSVPTCSNNTRRHPDVSFHSFPTDVFLRNKWICAILRDEGEHFKLLRGSMYVCSQHFNESDYSKTTGAKRLKQGAVPSRVQWTNPGCFAQRNYLGKLRKARNMRGMNSEKLPDHAYTAPPPPPPASQPFRPFIVESDEKTLNSFRKPPQALAHPQEAQRDNQSSGSEEQVIPVVQKKPLKEKDKDFLCEDASSSLGHVIHIDQNSGGEFEEITVKEEESEDKDYLCTVGHAVDQQSEEFVRITVKEEEPEDDDYQCGATSSEVGRAIPVDQHNIESEANPVKNEEPDDDGYLSKSNSLLQVFSCSWCPLFYTSEIHLDEHVKRRHSEELEMQQKTAETPSSISQQTSPGPFYTNTSDAQIQKKVFQCPECEKSFSHLSNFQIHTRVHTGEKPYHCSECGKSFAQQNNLQSHQRVHTGEKPYCCSQCGRRFNREDNLRIHRRIHTGEKPYCCGVCTKSFAHRSALQIHHRVHTGEKPYQCTQCAKSFTQLTHLQQHKLTHNREKPYQCLSCRKCFSQQCYLQAHQRVHTGEKPYCCTQCGKTFTHQSTLRRHGRVHTGEKPYQCSHCAKSFSHKSTFQIHQRTHTGERPCECLECGKRFTHQQALLLHQRTHTGEKPYHCSQCEKSFRSQSHLQRHQRTHTGEEPYLCSQCGRSFCYSSTFKTHKCIGVERTALS